MPILHQLPMDRSLIEAAINAQKQVLVEKTPPSPMPPPSMTNTGDYMLGNSMNSLAGGSSTDFKGQSGNKNNDEDLLGKENINANADANDEYNSEPPAIGKIFRQEKSILDEHK